MWSTFRKLCPIRWSLRLAAWDEKVTFRAVVPIKMPAGTILPTCTFSKAHQAVVIFSKFVQVHIVWVKTYNRPMGREPKLVIRVKKCVWIFSYCPPRFLKINNAPNRKTMGTTDLESLCGSKTWEIGNLYGTGIGRKCQCLCGFILKVWPMFVLRCGRYIDVSYRFIIFG